MPDGGVRESEVPKIDLLSGYGIEEVVKVQLELVSLVDVQLINKESGRPNEFKVLVGFSDALEASAHEELIA